MSLSPPPPVSSFPFTASVFILLFFTTSSLESQRLQRTRERQPAADLKSAGENYSRQEGGERVLVFRGPAPLAARSNRLEAHWRALKAGGPVGKIPLALGSRRPSH